MNLRYLYYLRLVIEHGSFDAAAKAGGVSQPAISHGMRQLQRQFDTPLFVPSGRRLLPTETALQAALKSMDLAERIGAIATASAVPAHRDTLRVEFSIGSALTQPKPARRSSKRTTGMGATLGAGACDDTQATPALTWPPQADVTRR